MHPVSSPHARACVRCVSAGLVSLILVLACSSPHAALPARHQPAPRDAQTTLRRAPQRASPALTLPQTTDELVAIVKYAGCNLDGLLWANDTPDGTLPDIALYAQLAGRSRCRYLSRAIETWNSPPDFATVRRHMRYVHAVSHRAFLFGINLAESVSLTAVI